MLLNFNSSPKINDLDFIVWTLLIRFFQENDILQFQISMNDILIVQVAQNWQQLFHDNSDCLFTDLSFFL